MKQWDIARQAVKAHAETVVKTLFPHATIQRGKALVGDLAGTPGKSLVIELSGDRAGCWLDFATGQSGDLFHLIEHVQGCGRRDALKYVSQQFHLDLDLPTSGIRQNPGIKVANTQNQDAQYWLQSVRKLTPEIIRRYKLGLNQGQIDFPFYDAFQRDQINHVKTRTFPEKKFFSTKDTGSCLFGWQAMPCPTPRMLVITEGELDALAAAQYGYFAVSIPHGAGAKKLDWVENEKAALDLFDLILLSMDNDPAGQSALAPLIKELGSARCLVLTLPEGQKDFNDCLVAGLPKAAIDKAVDKARHWGRDEQLGLAAVDATDIRTEKILLAVALQQPERLNTLSKEIVSSAFHWALNRWLFDLMTLQLAEKKEISLHALMHAIADLPEDQKPGAYREAWLWDLLYYPVPTDLKPIIDKFLAFAAQRRYIQTMEAALQAAQKSLLTQKSPEDVMLLVNQHMAGLSQLKKCTAGRAELHPIGVQIEATYQKLLNPDPNRVCLEFPWPEMHLAGGLRPQSYNLIAGRPGHGKTAVALNLARFWASQHKVVQFYSLEMSAQSLHHRLYSLESGVPIRALDNHWALTSEQKALLNAAHVRIKSWPCYIDDDPGSGPLKIQQDLELLSERGQKPDVVILDYIGLMKPEQQGYRKPTEYETISANSMALRNLAKSHNVPMVVLAQIGRDTENRQNKRPTSSDLKGSGQLEQDADLILMVYNDYYCNRNSERPNQVELICTKQRNGTTFNAHLDWVGETNQIKSRTQQYGLGGYQYGT